MILDKFINLDRPKRDHMEDDVFNLIKNGSNRKDQGSV